MVPVLDHVFILCSPGAPESGALNRLGLTEGSPNTHPGQGTACRRFFFSQRLPRAVVGTGRRGGAERAFHTNAPLSALVRQAEWCEPFWRGAQAERRRTGDAFISQLAVPSSVPPLECASRGCPRDAAVRAGALLLAPAPAPRGLRGAQRARGPPARGDVGAHRRPGAAHRRLASRRGAGTRVLCVRRRASRRARLRASCRQRWLSRPPVRVAIRPALVTPPREAHLGQRPLSSAEFLDGPHQDAQRQDPPHEARHPPARPDGIGGFVSERRCGRRVHTLRDATREASPVSRAALRWA